MEQTPCQRQNRRKQQESNRALIDFESADGQKAITA